MGLEQNYQVKTLKKKGKTRDTFNNQLKFLLVWKEKMKVNSKNKTIYYIKK